MKMVRGWDIRNSSVIPNLRFIARKSHLTGRLLIIWLLWPYSARIVYNFAIPLVQLNGVERVMVG